MRSLLIICCFLPLLLSAQKVLQLEKSGKVKTQKFYIGDEITYQLAGDDTWYTAAIVDINPEEGYLLMNGRLVRLMQIVALRSYKSRGWSKAVGRQLLNFGVGWIGFGIADRLIFDDTRQASWSLILVPASTAFALSWIIPKAFQHRTLKLGKRKRLRLLDLSPLPLGGL